MIQNKPGARNISDYVVIFGENRELHDAALKEVIQRLSDSVLTLNGKKCVFRINKISIFEVFLSENGISPDPAKVKAGREFSHP